MTCKDCIHYEACHDMYYEERATRHFDPEKHNAEKECGYFKDRSRFVELPIKPGEKIYYFDTAGEAEQALSRRTQKKENDFYRGHCVSDDGKFCKHIKAAKGDNLSNDNTMSCEYGEVNCPYAKPLEEVSTK